MNARDMAMTQEVHDEAGRTVTRRKILVFRSVNVHETARALQHLRSRFPDAEISLLLPAHLMEYLAEHASVDRFVMYDHHAKGKSWKDAYTLIRSLRRERFDQVVVLCPDRTRIANLNDVILFSLCIPARRRIILDSRLRESGLSFTHRVRVVLESALSLLASAVAAFVTLLLLAWNPRPSAGDRSPARNAGKPQRIAVLVPILPDISHTFVYREVLEMKKFGADFLVIALEQGDYAPLHPEAKALLDVTRFAPKLSLLRYLTYYLSFALTSPRRMAEVIRMCRPYAHGDRLLFVRVDQFHNFMHPAHGIGLAWMLRRLGVTSVHVYGSTYPSTRAMTAARLLNIPFSTTAFVDFDFEYDFKMLHEKLQHSAFFVTHTEFCRSRLMALDPDADPAKIHTIRIGVDPDEWRPALSPTLSPGPPKLLAVCRFVEKKGLDVLVRACAILKKREVPFQCLLIGDGPEMGRLQSLIAELHLAREVTFTGALTTDQVRAYLLPSNIIVVPSVYAKDGERDGIPTVLVEAMACGVPAVASRISGIPELVEDGQCGLLVPERNDRRLASAIERVLGDPGLRARFGRNGRRKVLREFHIHTNALRLWTLILKEHDHHH